MATPVMSRENSGLEAARIHADSKIKDLELQLEMADEPAQIETLRQDIVKAKRDYYNKLLDFGAQDMAEKYAEQNPEIN